MNEDNTKDMLVCITMPKCLCTRSTSGFDCDCLKHTSSKWCPNCGAKLVTVDMFEQMHNDLVMLQREQGLTRNVNLKPSSTRSVDPKFVQEAIGAEERKPDHRDLTMKRVKS